MARARHTRRVMTADEYKVAKAVTTADIAESGKLAPAHTSALLVEQVPDLTALSDMEEFAEVTASAADVGVMIAFGMPEEVAKSLAIPGYEPAADLHLTLAYLGKLGTLPKGAVKRAVKALAEMAQTAEPLAGKVGGVGRFSASETTDGKDVIYASVDAPGMVDFRKAIVDALKAVKLDISTIHDFTPHVTLAYIGTEDDSPVKRIPLQPVKFDILTVAVGDEQYLIKLGAAEEEPPEEVDDGPETEDNFTFVATIAKADAKEHIVTGVVLQPETVDAQGDIISKDVIKEAAYNFLAEYNKQTKLGLQHTDFSKPFQLVESYIAPVNMILNGRKIKAGSWVMSVKILDPLVWARVEKGEITGFSIGGVARVKKLAA